MSESKSDHYVPRPLGEMRDLNKEESDRLLALPFEKVTEYRDLQIAFDIAIEELNFLRKGLGLPEISYETDTVRLINEKAYDTDPYAQKASEGEAFFHPKNRKAFIRFSESMFFRDAYEKMWKVYSVAHELGHSAMAGGGLSKALSNEPGLDFIRLSEGFVDWLAKDIVNRRILKKITSETNIESRKIYIQNMKPVIEGIEIQEDDILPTAPGENLVAFSYIPEIRLIEYLKSNHLELFQSLLKAAFEGERDRASILLEKSFGAEIRDMFADGKVSTKDLLTQLAEQK